MNGPGSPEISRLGRMAYGDAWTAMRRYTDERDAATPDALWCVEHPPVFTLGLGGRREHVLDAGDIPVIGTDRGGQVTYHGPGQIVAYPLVDLRRLGIGVRELVTRIEAAVIEVLAHYGVKAARTPGAPGVYVDGVKIAALGLRVRRGCSFHGLAFNIDMDLEPYQRINPCGFEGLEVTSLAQFADVTLGEVQARLVARLAVQLGYNKRFTPAGGELP